MSSVFIRERPTPWPSVGGSACAASPTSATRPRTQDHQDLRTKSSRSASVLEIKSRIAPLRGVRTGSSKPRAGRRPEFTPSATTTNSAFRLRPAMVTTPFGSTWLTVELVWTVAPFSSARSSRARIRSSRLTFQIEFTSRRIRRCSRRPDLSRVRASCRTTQSRRIRSSTWKSSSTRSAFPSGKCPHRSRERHGCARTRQPTSPYVPARLLHSVPQLRSHK